MIESRPCHRADWPRLLRVWLRALCRITAGVLVAGVLAVGVHLRQRALALERLQTRGVVIGMPAYSIRRPPIQVRVDTLLEPVLGRRGFQHRFLCLYELKSASASAAHHLSADSLRDMETLGISRLSLENIDFSKSPQKHWPGLPKCIESLNLHLCRNSDLFLSGLGPSPGLKGLNLHGDQDPEMSLRSFQLAGQLERLSIGYGDKLISLDCLKRYASVKHLGLPAWGCVEGTEWVLLDLDRLDHLEPEISTYDPGEWLEVIRQHPTLKLLNHSPVAEELPRIEAAIAAEEAKLQRLLSPTGSPRP